MLFLAPVPKWIIPDAQALRLQRRHRTKSLFCPTAAVALRRRGWGRRVTQFHDCPQILLRSSAAGATRIQEQLLHPVFGRHMKADAMANVRMRLCGTLYGM